jgi:hypothetical protein
MLITKIRGASSVLRKKEPQTNLGSTHIACVFMAEEIPHASDRKQ